LKGESPQSRRFILAKNMDAIITIKGEKHTATVLDFALAINKPSLPLPFTGGEFPSPTGTSTRPAFSNVSGSTTASPANWNLFH
jgi:hypothetical protein